MHSKGPRRKPGSLFFCLAGIPHVWRQRCPSTPGIPHVWRQRCGFHAVRARYAIERGRLWQAEYWTSAVRDHALMLGCKRLGLEAGFGRGFDALPEEIRTAAAESLVRSIDGEELLRALGAATEMLLSESDGLHEASAKISALLREILE